MGAASKKFCFWCLWIIATWDSLICGHTADSGGCVTFSSDHSDFSLEANVTPSDSKIHLVFLQ